MATQYAKLVNGNIDFLIETTKLVFIDNEWIRIDKTEQDILTEGYKPYVVNDKPSYNVHTQYLTSAYVDTGSTIELQYTVVDYTAEELAQNEAKAQEELVALKSSWALPRFDFFNGLLLASSIRFGELPTKNMLIDYIMNSPEEAYRPAAETAGVPFTPEFVALARQTAIIDVEESPVFTRYNPTIVGMLSSIGRPAKDENGNDILNEFGLPILVDQFSEEEIDNWFATGNYLVLLTGMQPPTTEEETVDPTVEPDITPPIIT